MECFGASAHLKCSLYHKPLLFTIWLYSSQDVGVLRTPPPPDSGTPNTFVLSDPPVGLFDPIQISPAVVPRYPYLETLPPMYPSFPTTYGPVLTGKCPSNFSDIQVVMDKTATDCAGPFAVLVGNVLCCPEVSSLLHIFLGYYSTASDVLVLHKAAANDCFSDIISILSSRGANSTILTLCSVKSSNLTGGSCPVKDVATFEKTANTTKLLDASSSVDPLKECCRPVCRPAIVEAALHVSGVASSFVATANIIGKTTKMEDLSDCKGVVHAWLSRKLTSDAANTGFRILSACKVNKDQELEVADEV